MIIAWLSQMKALKLLLSSYHKFFPLPNICFDKIQVSEGIFLYHRIRMSKGLSYFYFFVAMYLVLCYNIHRWHTDVRIRETRKGKNCRCFAWIQRAIILL